ncbi:MAG: response regulator transcription factor [Clostridiales bacterium]|nr:response regulator transcription factor [Clostridiales bacterium]
MVLICDDNISVHKALSAYLRDTGIEVVSSYNGADALQALRQHMIQFVILDLMLPDLSGFEVLKEIRSFSDVPVLILSAKNTEAERILGLELGADDYIAKPFSAREIATRVQVILRRARRSSDHEPQLVSFTNLSIDLTSFTARIDKKELSLTPMELKILALFAGRPNTVLSREQIIGNVWGYDYYGDIRTVDTQINHIRRKIKKTRNFRLLLFTALAIRWRKYEAETLSTKTFYTGSHRHIFCRSFGMPRRLAAYCPKSKRGSRRDRPESYEFLHRKSFFPQLSQRGKYQQSEFPRFKPFGRSDLYIRRQSGSQFSQKLIRDRRQPAV